MCVVLCSKGYPEKFKKNIARNLRGYNLVIYNFNANEKTKSFKSVNTILEMLLAKNFNRSDPTIPLAPVISIDQSLFLENAILSVSELTK